MKNKNVKTLKALKTRLKKSLPEKISQVIESYDSFAEQPVPEDAKGFTAHHNACKSAVVHAETLLKLARWTSDEVPAAAAESSDQDWQKLLDEAGALETALDETDDEED